MSQMTPFPDDSLCSAVHLRTIWCMIDLNRSQHAAGEEVSSRCRIDVNILGCWCGFQRWPLPRRVSQASSSSLSLFDRHTNAPKTIQFSPDKQARAAAHLPTCQRSLRDVFRTWIMYQFQQKRQCLHFSLPCSLSRSLSLCTALPFWSENRVQKKAVAMVIHPLALPGTFLATRCAGGFSSPVTFCNFHSNYITPACTVCQRMG